MFPAVENHRPEPTDVDDIQGRIKKGSDPLRVKIFWYTDFFLLIEFP